MVAAREHMPTRVRLAPLCCDVQEAQCAAVAGCFSVALVGHQIKYVDIAEALATLLVCLVVKFRYVCMHEAFGAA